MSSNPQHTATDPLMMEAFDPSHCTPLPSLEDGLYQLQDPVTFIKNEQGLQAYQLKGKNLISSSSNIIASLPACSLNSLGSGAFCKDYQLHYAYVAGSMAKGISSVELVEALCREGLLAFFGAGGLDVSTISQAIDRLQQSLPNSTWGVNLLHSPTEPRLERETVNLLLQKQIHLVEAAAYLDLTEDIVRYRTAGLHRDAEDRVVIPNRIMAKVSREEIAEKFCSPPPEKHIKSLVEKGLITQEQAALAAQIPMADAITAEADSGGHSDNRPMPALFPTIQAVRDRILAERNYDRPIYMGLGGGIGTPAAAAAALAMGAEYIVTGSINQACIEAATSDAVRQILAETRQADITMAPAADMFEMGGKVQVVKRGTMFSMRASKLYELYRSYYDWSEIPQEERAKIEKTILQSPFETIWHQTRQYFQQHDPSQVERGDADSRHRLALVFRWYLGMSPHWANQGKQDRKIDYQIWCGPAMGAFNEWAKGSCLEAPGDRRVAEVALNLLWGAALHIRLLLLRQQGFPVEKLNLSLKPMTSDQLKEYLR